MQLSTFAANIMAPIDKAIEDNRSLEDIAGIIEEVRVFACPTCGHIDPDHRWLDPFDCLKEDCPCEAFPQPDTFDEDELMAQINAIIRGKAA